MIFSRGNRFDVFLLGPEGETGVLTAGGQTGKALYGVTEPVYYVAPDIISEDEVTVQFWARISKEGVGGSGAGVGMKAVEGKDSAMKVRLKEETIQINQKLMGQMEQSSCVMRNAVIKSYPLCKNAPIVNIKKVHQDNNRACDLLTGAGTTFVYFGDRLAREDNVIISICFDEKKKKPRIQIEVIQALVIYGVCENDMTVVNSIDDIPAEKLCEYKNEIKERIKFLKEPNNVDERVMPWTIALREEIMVHERAHVPKAYKDVQAAVNKVLKKYRDEAISWQEAKELESNYETRLRKEFDIQREIEDSYSIFRKVKYWDDERNARKAQAKYLESVLKEIKCNK